MNPASFINALFALLLIAVSLVFMILSVGFGAVSFFLARRKGISVLKWNILGMIPIVNFFCVTYLVGVPPSNTVDIVADSKQRAIAGKMANSSDIANKDEIAV